MDMAPRSTGAGPLHRVSDHVSATGNLALRDLCRNTDDKFTLLCQVFATFPQNKVLSTVDIQLLRAFTTLRPGTNLNTKYIPFYPYYLTSKPPAPRHCPSKMSEHHYKFNVQMSCGGCSGAVERVLKKLDGM